jgi:imidazolonepropionase-like amidohydrolase
MTSEMIRIFLSRDGALLWATERGAMTSSTSGLTSNEEPLVFDGAQIIPGDEREAIPNGALVVRAGSIEYVGPSSELRSFPHVPRIDLRGQTIMPTIIDAHGHVGYMKGASTSRENYSRANVLDHLRRLSYYGVSVIQSLGTDRLDIELQIRDDQISGRLDERDLARLMTTGAGIAAPTPGSENGGPYFAADVVRDAASPEDARRLVRDLAAKRPDGIKFWIDDREGTKSKLEPDTYEALIDEAHQNGLRAIAHIYYLEDAKQVIRAGVDAIAHMVREPEADDEFIELLVTNGVYAFTSMSVQNCALDLRWLQDPALAETVPESTRAEFTAYLRQTSVTPPSAFSQDAYSVLETCLRKYIDGGVKIVFSGDSGAVAGIFGFAQHRELEALVVAGMTPTQAIRVATSSSAEFLGLHDRGALSVGRQADFIVLAGDPLVDIRNTRRIVDVYFGGAALDRRKMQQNWIVT